MARKYIFKTPAPKTEMPLQEPDIPPPVDIKAQQIAHLATTKPDMTAGQLAHATGTSKQKVIRTLADPVTIQTVSNYLDQAGASIEKAAQVIAEGMEAKKIKYFSNWGKITDSREEPDHEIRLKAVELNVKLRRLLDPDNGKKNGNTLHAMAAIIDDERKKRGLPPL